MRPPPALPPSGEPSPVLSPSNESSTVRVRPPIAPDATSVGESFLMDERQHHRAMDVVLGASATLLLVSIGLWSFLPSARISPDLPTVVPVVHGTDTVTQVADLTDDGRASLLRAQRTRSEHTSLKIQAQGAHDLVQAWALRNGAVLGKVQVTARKGDSRCTTTMTHGKDRSHAMIGHAADPISACRALIAGMEARYPDLAQVAQAHDLVP